MEVTSELLSSFDLLRPLPKETLDYLASRCVVEKFSRRGVVIDPKEQDGSICFLFEGRLQSIAFTIDGREVGLNFVHPGDFCGEVPLFDELAKPEFIVALTHSVVVKVPMSEMRAIMLETASVMNILGNKLATRVRQLTSQRSLLAISNVQQRVCCQLWMLAVDENPKAHGGDKTLKEIRYPPTHLEIAIMLNISRETVTRVFQTLQNRQIVQRNGSSSLLVIKPDALKQLAEGDSWE